MTAPPVPRHARFLEFAGRHQGLFWWVHSLYALVLGVGVMWLGARNFGWLRIAAFNIAFVWVTSLLAAGVVDRRATESPWWRRLRLVINYINRNAYQQVLFFIVPVYYGSATGWSPNMGFVALLGLSALLSTLDLVYDRFLTVNPWRAASFFAFNAFATVNVALPVLFGVANHTALRVAAVAGALGFATIAIRPARLRRRRTWLVIAGGTAIVLLVADAARPLVPPAPLRLTRVSFGTEFDRSRFQVLEPTVEPLAPKGYRIYVVTAVDAPVGLKDRVALRWSQGPHQIWSSPAHTIEGGRTEGFRLWSSVATTALRGTTPLRLEVVTEAGQLIGRAQIAVRSTPE